MSGMDPRAAIGGGILIVAMLYALVTFERALSGEITLAEAFEPAWMDFAIANPMPFAILLILGTLLFGSAFVAAVESV